MAWFGLGNLLQGYEAKATIWFAFLLMQLGTLVKFIFQRYPIALRGMNYVALINRWQILFGIISVFAGGLTLWFGGGIVELVVAMQSVAVVGILRFWYLLRIVEEGRVLSFSQYSFDREVFRWAWEPTWKGFVGQFGQLGAVQLSAIIYTGFGSKGDIAAYLFSIKMMQTIVEMAMAPFGSVQPKMSRMRAAGDVHRLRDLVYRRGVITLGLMALMVLGGAILFPWGLEFLNSSMQFIPVPAWLLLGGLTIFARFNTICCAVAAIGNEMIYYWQQAIAALIGAAALYYFQDIYGVYTPILAAILPGLILMNIGPFRKAAKILH